MTLIASRCPQCRHVAYPTESTCSNCGRRGEHEPVPLGPEGTLYTFTVVYAAAPGIETPYALGYVDFEQGARVFGRILPQDGLVAGMKVLVVSGPESGTFWFEPIGAAGEIS